MVDGDQILAICARALKDRSLLAQLGVIICLGVLLDTLVVRTVLVPALALLLGDTFWWPRKVPAAAQVPAPANG